MQISHLGNNVTIDYWCHLLICMIRIYITCSAVDLVDTVEPRRDIPQSDTEPRDSIVKLTSKPR